MGAPRKIDYDQARRLRKAGWTYTRIGELFDCVPEAVRMALDDSAYEKQADARRRFQQRKFQVACPRCGTVRCVNVYQQDAAKLCRSCTIADRLAERITDTEARCTSCGEWKPHDAFHTRRGRPATLCRPCDTEAKRDWRRRNPAQSDVTDTTSLVWLNNKRRTA